MWHKTWHTTLLAEVGSNGEGPLPWVERDYTPISTWLGACSALPLGPHRSPEAPGLLLHGVGSTGSTATHPHVCWHGRLGARCV